MALDLLTVLAPFVASEETCTQWCGCTTIVVMLCNNKGRAGATRIIQKHGMHGNNHAQRSVEGQVYGTKPHQPACLGTAREGVQTSHQLVRKAGALHKARFCIALTDSEAQPSGSPLWVHPGLDPPKSEGHPGWEQEKRVRQQPQGRETATAMARLQRHWLPGCPECGRQTQT